MSEVENLSYESLVEGYHRRFEAMASQLGDFPAICLGERLISYRALNHRANQFAYAIEKTTDAPLIITWISDETLLIPLILAIAKSGRVWVPLSSRMPALMVAQYIAKFDKAAFLTDQNTPDEIETAHQIIAVSELDLPNNPSNISQPRSLDENIHIMPSLSAGSVLKAIPISSENAIRNLYTYALVHEIRFRDQLAFAGDPSFVGNLVVILTSLICGATIHIINFNQMSLGDFHDYLRKHAISSIHSTPSVFRVAFANVRPGDFPDLRLIRVGAETAFKSDLELFKANFARPIKFINGFGSTELGAISFFVADHDTFVDDERLPIGKVQSYLKLEIINDAGESVVGEEGEIYVYDKLLQAYWNETPENDSKFFPDPKNPEWMGYRSGDFGILLEDGNLIYSGRRDTQIKIRGQRVEIGTIEKRFRDHSAIAEVLVMTYENKNETRLVAYLLAKDGMQLPDENVLREFLGQTLSDYMIPSRFIVLEEMPRLPNGKINPKALPDPISTKIERKKPLSQPITKTEKQLLSIWQDILDFKDEISIDDSFFDLGGSSLQATALISDVNERFKVVLTPAMLYQFPSIQTLARLIDGDKINPALHPAIVPFRPYGNRYPVFCLPGALGNPLAFKALVHRLDNDIPVYGLQMQGLDRNEPLPKTLDELLNYYEIGIQSLGLKIPIYLMGLSIGGVHAFELARRLQKRQITVEAVILLDTFFPDTEQSGNDADREEAEILQQINKERSERRQRKQRLEDLSYKLKSYGKRLLSLPGKAISLAFLSPEARKALLEERNRKRQETRLLNERFRAGNPVDMNELLEEVRITIRKTAADYRIEPYVGNAFYIKAIQNSDNPNRAESWEKYVQGNFCVLEVDAPHTLLNIAHVDKVVKVLKESVWLEI